MTHATVHSWPLLEPRRPLRADAHVADTAPTRRRRWIRTAWRAYPDRHRHAAASALTRLHSGAPRGSCSGSNDAGYLSRLESGSERPEIKKLSEIEYAFAKLGEPLDPFEVRILEAAAIANSNWPSRAEFVPAERTSSFRNSPRPHRATNAGIPGSAGTPVRACA